MIKIKKSPRILLLMLFMDFCNFHILRITRSQNKFRPRFSGWEGALSFKRLIFLFFILVTSNCHAATYYFSTSGNNTTGTGTQASPFYSLCGPWSNSGCATGENKISLGQISIQPGDQLLFKRGDEWVGLNAQWNVNVKGDANNPVVFGAWGDSNLPRPIFRGAKSAFELGKDNWTNVAGTPIWYTTGINWWPHVASQEDTAPEGPQLYGAWSVQGTTNANGWNANQSMVRGTYFYESSTQRLYVWRTDNLKPDHVAGRDIFIGKSPEDGTTRLIKVNRGWPNGSTDPKYQGGHYIFQDLHAKLSSGYGFSSSYPNTKFINCLSELNAMEGFLFDASRFGAPAPGAKDNSMKQCVSRRNNLKQGSAIGQGITVEAENFLMEDSESYENAWAGIDFLEYNTSTKTNGGKVINSKIHHNGIHPVSEANFDPNIYIDGGSDILIQNCQIWAAGVDPRGVKTRLRSNAGISIDLEGPAFSIGRRPKNIKVINSLIYGNAGPSIAIGLINGSQNAVSTLSNIEIIGNTLHRDRADNDIKSYYDPNVTDAGIRVFRFTSISSGLVFKNNIVLGYNTARAPVFGSKSLIDSGKLGADFNNNIYYCPGCNFNTNGSYNSGGFFSYNYIQNLTFDQWRNLGAQASMQRDEALSKTTVTSNPLIKNAALISFDGRLLDGSGAFDAADVSVFPANLTFSGTTRPDGLADNPYNDLGYHYPITGPPAPPVLDTQAPTAPTSLAATQLGGQVLLSWNPSTDNVGVTHYDVYDGDIELGTTPNAGYAINNSVPGKIYNFMVKAYDLANNASAASGQVTYTVPQEPVTPLDTTPPSAPAGLNATVLGTQVTLLWNASTDDTAVTQYEILHNGQKIGTSVSTSFLHNGTSGATYNYTVIAYDAALNVSASSSIVTITIPSQTATGLPVPANLTASVVGSQIQLSWTASSGAAGYNIYRNSAYLKSVGTISTFDNGAVPGTTYTYYVKAYDVNAVKSAASNTVTAQVPGTVADTESPAVPGAFQASFVTDRIEATWSAATDNVAVTAYEVFNGAAKIATTSQLLHIISSPLAGASYLLKVRSCDASGNCSGDSGVVTVNVPALVDTEKPSAPTNVNAVVSGTQIILSWSFSNDNLGVSGYQIFEGASMLGTSAVTNYTLEPVVEGQSYFITIKAFDAQNNVSLPSETITVQVPDITPPTAPANLSAAASASQAVLNWGASTDNIAVTGYQIFESGLKIGVTANLSFTATNLLSGKSYNFVVKAVDAAANVSASSNPVTVGVAGPATPENLIAYSTGSSIYVSWSTSANAIGYTVYRNDTFLRNNTASSFYDSSVIAGQTYAYKVQAYDGLNNFSGFSNVMSVTLPGLAAPTNLTAKRTGSNVSLSWNAVSGASGYNIYKNGAYLKSQTTTTASDNASNGQIFSYTVKAYNSSGLKSPSSNSVTV